jgi:hypothetical protein
MKNIWQILIGMVIGAVLIWGTIVLSSRVYDRSIARAVESGRLSTGKGIYYLVPVPTLQEYNQLQLDLKMYAKVKNKKGVRR